MADPTPEEDAASARATEQARLRKARREAKIKAGAESRLKTITGLGGGVQRDPAPAPSATTADATASATASAAQHADPEEVDISQHFYQPQTTPRVPPTTSSNGTSTPNLSESQLRQMMLGLDRTTPGTGTPAPGAMPGMEDDPMLRMMMQMLGGPTNPFGTNVPPPAFPSGQPHPATTTTTTPTMAMPPNRSIPLYRLLHTLVALALGLYIALYTPFTGTKLSRDRAAAAAAGSVGEREYLGGDGDVKRNFFWGFATAEVVLLTTRYVVEQRRRGAGGGGAAGDSGLWEMLAGLLPAHVRTKVEVVMRYGEVLVTVRRDMLVCVFVLGVAAWWRG